MWMVLLVQYFGIECLRKVERKKKEKENRREVVGYSFVDITQSGFTYFLRG